jgi:hypothetical protein
MDVIHGIENLRLVYGGASSPGIGWNLVVQSISQFPTLKPSRGKVYFHSIPPFESRLSSEIMQSILADTRYSPSIHSVCDVTTRPLVVPLVKL